MIRVAMLGLTAALLLTGATMARADSFTPAQRADIIAIVRDALKQDPTILRDAVEALQADEGAKQDAAAKSAIATYHRALVADPSDPVAGNPTGDVTVVEFFDTRCPYCRKLEPAMGELLHGDHGVRLVYKDLPVLGPPSVIGSKALLAAQRQQSHVPDAYEKLRTIIMQPSTEQTTDGIVAAAGRVGLDTDALKRDMADPAIQRRLDANIQLARKLGIDGTPAIVVGDRLIPGAVDVAELQAAVKSARTQ